MNTISFSIDGQELECEKDRMLLDVALENDIHIPALCHHAAQSPYGACRLCLVEISVGKYSWLSPACTFPVRDEGMRVRTSNEKIERFRRLNLELLLARCPESEELREYAAKMGVEESRFPKDGKDTCISCGLCVNVCRDVVGAAAISFMGRGESRRVETPYDRPSEVCIGCGVCAELCPTERIQVVDREDGTREIVPFHTSHKLVPCPECGKRYVTERQLQFLKKQLGEKNDILETCPVCREKKHAGRIREIYDKMAPIESE